MAITHPLNPPSSQLPPIAKIKTTPVQDIAHAIGYLRLLYNPDVRGTRCVGRKLVFSASRIASDSTEAFSEGHEVAINPSSTSDSSSSLDALRGDEFERSYAIRWLTSLVARADILAARDDRSFDPGDPEAYDLAWENLIEDAAALLAVCAGTASAGSISRAFAFRHKTGREVKVQITDVPLENQDYSSVGAQTWGSACLLAEMIVDNPGAFGLGYSDPSQRPMRVLELGAGTGLVSMTVGGLFKGFFGSDKASVIATDFHLSVLQNLHKNIAFNTSSWPEPCPVTIAAHHLDWSNLPASPGPPPFNQSFDQIFGADVIYEINHAAWIRSCIERFLRKASNSSTDVPRFHLVTPLRPTHTAEAQTVEEVFPFASQTTASSSGTPTLGIISKEILLCEVQGGLRSRTTNGNLVEYVYYTIAWV
ncbi:hypothetical protein EIP91_007696 [Steccherinum ochraceum]|uniref:S-adenosylmethionine-dependent methyltransferase n=1 Tax=Steccherinum ochraceum TaxID=92696 RepID=A0A4R0RE54_9APHY|nr:hypothetical protein EIP91_007696 [Steccherinum ochraceum]